MPSHKLRFVQQMRGKTDERDRTDPETSEAGVKVKARLWGVFASELGLKRHGFANFT
jgi:hypothetical protein